MAHNSPSRVLQNILLLCYILRLIIPEFKDYLEKLIYMFMDFMLNLMLEQLIYCFMDFHKC